MKRRILASIAVLLGVCTALSAQSNQELFNQALIQERAAGDLDQAIQLYQRVAKESQDNRALAVQALMGAARSYQKLGQTAQSKGLYEEVIRSYSDQKEQAELARGYLADTGMIQGTVVRSGTSEPVPDAKVSLSGGPIDPGAFAELQAFFKGRGVEISAPPNGVVDDAYVQKVTDIASARGVSMANPGVQAAIGTFIATNDSRFKAKSDNEGHFTIRNVPPGRYAITSEREGFFPLVPDTSGPKEVTVSAGKTALADVTMVRGSTINGRVTDGSGQPQSNIVVQAFSVVYQAGLPVLQPAAAKVTNDQGEYRLFWLTAGEYLVAVTPGVKLEEAGLSQSTAALPGPDGGFPSAKTFYPGATDIASAISVFVRSDAPVSGIDIQVRKVPTFHIKGTIRSHIPRVTTYVTANFALRARNTNSPDEYATPTMAANLPASGTDYVGEFDLSNVPAGSYNLRAWAREQNPDGGANLAFASIDVDVVNSDVTGITLDIYPTVRVNGTVTIDGNPPGQVPARVWLQADGSAARAGVYQGLAARTSLANSQTGAFMIPAVPVGHFRPMLGAGLPPDMYLADVRQGGVSVFDAGFDVGKESPLPLQVLIRSGARTVEGTVRDALGKPVAGATAVLVPPRDRRMNRALYFTAKADAVGHFKIQGVAPGNYSLLSWQNMPDRAYFTDRFVSRNEDAARRVNVTQSSITGADITLIPMIGK